MPTHSHDHSPFRLPNVVVLCCVLVFIWNLQHIPHTLGSTESPEASQALHDATASHEQARQLLEKGDYTSALAPAEHSLQLREAALGQNHLIVAESLNTLGLVFHYLARIDEALHAHERALQIRQKQDGVDSGEVGESLTNLARILVSKGDFPKAQTMLEQSLRIREQVFGKTHRHVAETLMYLAMVQGLQMNLQDALSTQARAVTLYDHDPQAPPLEHSMALTSYGVILSRNGELAKGKQFLERALLLQEGNLGPTHPIVARTLDSLAELEMKMGHSESGLPLAQRAMEIREQRLGQDHPEVSASFSTLGTLFWRQGNLAEATRYFQRALESIEQTVGPVHPVVAANLLSLGELHRQTGDLKTAQTLFSRALEIQEATLGPHHNDMATTLTRLAWVAGQQGRHDQSESLLEQAVLIRESALGPDHPDLALLCMELARTRHRIGKLPESKLLYERGRRIYLMFNRLNQHLDESSFRNLHQQGMAGLRDYALLLAHMAQQASEPEIQQSLVQDSFLVAEQARGWVVQSAVAKALARKQIQQQEEGELVKTVETLRRRREKIWSALHTLYAQPSTSYNPQSIQDLKQDIQDVQSRLEASIRAIEQRFPAYSEMAFPKPVDLQSVQKYLHEGEAMISLYVWDHILQAWFIRSGHPPLSHTQSLSKKDIADLVGHLRASMNSAKQHFDAQGARQLYTWLLQPFEAHISNITHLIVIPDEVLLPLPFAVLLTETEKTDSAHALQPSSARPTDAQLQSYAQLPWLIKRFPVTIVPSASALTLLRQSAPVTLEPTERFIGFGDPRFMGDGRERGGKMPTIDESGLAWDQLRMMNALPGTQQELLSIAQTLGVNPNTNVFLQNRATETQVRGLLKAGRLGKTQVLSFATHGLLAGQLTGLVEPALVLTIPAHPSAEDDGLLTMSEILDFQLPQVDWVILSACNTAGSDGSGQGLTGLARAFFFAGAKALLVSHWSVDDRATQTLMTQIFRLFGRDHTLSKSAALREGMLALMEEGKTGTFPYFSHPYAWAPFFLVGMGE